MGGVTGPGHRSPRSGLQRHDRRRPSGEAHGGAGKKELSKRGLTDLGLMELAVDVMCGNEARCQKSITVSTLGSENFGIKMRSGKELNGGNA